jgi:hypothetical protein
MVGEKVGFLTLFTFSLQANNGSLEEVPRHNLSRITSIEYWGVEGIQQR